MNRRQLRRTLQGYLKQTANLARSANREVFFIEWLELLSDFIMDDELVDKIDALGIEVNATTYTESAEVRQKVKEVIDDHKRQIDT